MKKQQLYILAGVGVILIGGAVLMWQRKVSQKLPQQQTQEETVVETLTTDNLNTSDWKTYRNTKYGYSFKYPSDWFVETKYSDKDFSSRGGGDVMGGDTVISNYQNPSTYTLDNVPADMFVVNLFIYRVDEAIAYDQFIAQQNYELSAKDKKQEIGINGINAVQLRMATVDHPTGFDVIATFFHRGDQMFVLNYSGNANDLNEMSIADRIVYSFAF